MDGQLPEYLERVNERYPEHDRSSCNDTNRANVDPDGSGCRRCNALELATLDALRAEINLVSGYARGLSCTTPKGITAYSDPIRAYRRGHKTAKLRAIEFMRRLEAIAAGE